MIKLGNKFIVDVFEDIDDFIDKFTEKVGEGIVIYVNPSDIEPDRPFSFIDIEWDDVGSLPIRFKTGTYTTKSGVSARIIVIPYTEPGVAYALLINTQSNYLRYSDFINANDSWEKNE